MPPWWRPYWGVVALGILTLLLIDEDYSLIVPWLAGICAACFGFEYLAKQHGGEPSD